ncbi:MAG: hypothetical protein JXR79_08090 [Nitrospirae bacterium]|nr:hypothetical protein [Nitrospirota bacterium]
MGREHCGRRKLIYILIACLAIQLSGCAVLNNQTGRTAQHDTRKRVDSEEEIRAKSAVRHLSLSKKLLEQGDHDSSIKESQKALSLSGKSTPGDEALYTMGLAHIHHKNPKKDYEKSMILFNRMIREYPQSQLADHARTWIELLQVIEKLKKVDIVIEEKKKELSK